MNLHQCAMRWVQRKEGRFFCRNMDNNEEHSVCFSFFVSELCSRKNMNKRKEKLDCSNNFKRGASSNKFVFFSCLLIRIQWTEGYVFIGFFCCCCCCCLFWFGLVSCLFNSIQKQKTFPDNDLSLWVFVDSLLMFINFISKHYFVLWQKPHMHLHSTNSFY